MRVHLVGMHMIGCASATLREGHAGLMTVLLYELSQSANRGVVTPRFWRRITGWRAASGKAWEQHGQASSFCFVLQPPECQVRRCQCRQGCNAHRRADVFGHGLSPLRSNSILMPDNWSPAPAGGHQSLRHLLNGSGSAQRRQHGFQHNPHLPSGAIRTPATLVKMVTI